MHLWRDFMKNYSSNRAQKGKTAYRTPSRFKVYKSQFEPMPYVKEKYKDSFRRRVNNNTKERI